MKKLLLFSITSVAFAWTASPRAMAQSINNIAEATDGLTMTDGTFYATYSIQGMTYNPQSQSYEVNSSGSGSGSSLPDSGPLLSSYNSAIDKGNYFQGLTGPEKASLFGVLSP